MAMKTPSTGTSVISPVFTFFSFAPVTDFGFSVPSTSSSTVSHITLIFGLSNRRCCSTFSARSSSRRCTRMTSEAKLVRNSASSTAVLPPPTTMTFLPR